MLDETTDNDTDGRAPGHCPNCGADVTSENPAYLLKYGARCDSCLEADTNGDNQ